METKDDLSMLNIKLLEIEKSVKETITLALEMIKSDPSLEKELLPMFIKPAMRVNDYFYKETERTGTEKVGKNVIKYVMFKKY